MCHTGRARRPSKNGFFLTAARMMAASFFRSPGNFFNVAPVCGVLAPR